MKFLNSIPFIALVVGILQAAQGYALMYLLLVSMFSGYLPHWLMLAFKGDIHTIVVALEVIIGGTYCVLKFHKPVRAPLRYLAFGGWLLLASLAATATGAVIISQFIVGSHYIVTTLGMGLTIWAVTNVLSFAILLSMAFALYVTNRFADHPKESA